MKINENHKIAIIITRDDKRHKVAKLLNKNGFLCHFGAVGKGTAPSELSALLGLAGSAKAIFFVLIDQAQVQALFQLLDQELNFSTKKGEGLAFTVPISSVASEEMLELFGHLTNLR